MTSAQKGRKHSRGSRVSPVLEDRVAADGEQVLHTLEPNRTPETVRYPDPESPEHDPNATTPQTNAESQMARRTDAGPDDVAKEGPTLSARGSGRLLWGAGIAGLFLIIIVLIWLV